MTDLYCHEKGNRMAPTYYVEDYDGDRNDDAVDPVVLAPVVDAKVVEAAEPRKPARKSSQAKTKG